MGLVKIEFNYDFDKVPYSEGREKIYITDRNFKLKIKCLEDKLEDLTLKQIKAMYYKEAIREAAYKQLSEYGEFLNNSFR